MEKLVESGKARSIGLSNFNILKTKRILEVASIIPAVNQVELHPYFPQRELFNFSAKHGIRLMAHQPLGGRPVPVVRGHPDIPFPTDDQTINEIAVECGMTPAQVCLSWAIQRGIPVVPKSVQEGHMRENLQVRRLPDDVFDAVEAVSSSRGPIRFLDPGRHLGFDIFDEERDQPTSKRRLSGFLSRLGPESSSRKGSAVTTSASLIDTPDDHIGPLGLTTLYEPLPPLVPVANIVFIHGLAGGSRKTWSFSRDPSHFWPQKWLPADNDFRNVRILSFGYNSDWGARQQSVLDVRSIAESLVVALRNDPGMCWSPTRIILVGHSMGGFVAKCAYTIARRDLDAESFASRVHSIFFLATPHRGSNLAGSLDNFLTALGWGKKSYIADLKRNSPALAIINNEFRYVAPDLQLWSFYETLSTQRAGFNKLVVERDSAALGFPHEHIVAMNADHRHVLRDALHRAVSLIRELALAGNSLTTSVSAQGFPIPSRSHTTPSANSPMASRLDNEIGSSDTHPEPSVPLSEATSLLRSFLDVDESFEDDFATLQERKELGFKSWRDSKAPGILWLVGRPGAGKSILSSHVIEQLASPAACCSYFIFKHSESTWSTCFRSLAFQMAVRDTLVQDALLKLQRDGRAWDKTDETSLPSLARHFWVIDGVDELLMALPKELKLFATSRDWAEIDRGLKALGPSRASRHILTDVDTAEDMRHSPGKRETMCGKILGMSSGLFLWVLDMIPADLSDLWRKPVARSILSWVVLACRPLTVDELTCAVKLDIGETLQDAAKAIPNICAQLVFVDQNDRFLVNDGLNSGLRYLCSGVFNFLRAGTRQASIQDRPRSLSKHDSPIQPPNSSPSILEYACAFFSEHLDEAKPSDHHLMGALSAFFQGSVLFWIEHIALRRNLTPIIRAASKIREYLGKSMNQPLHHLDRWPTELIRVAAKFRPQLLTCPSSIHHLIPPLCPSESLIAQTFGNNLQSPLTSPGLTVKGLPSAAWESDDCLIRMDFPDATPTVVSHGINLFAIGLDGGKLSLYDAISIQVLRKMRHPGPEVIRCLQFGPSDMLLASCSSTHLFIWDTTTGTALHSFPTRSEPWAMTFLGADTVLAVFHFCELTTWRLETKQHQTISWKTLETCYGREDSSSSRSGPHSLCFASAAFLVTEEQVLLAITSGNGPVFILKAPDLQLVHKLEHGSMPDGEIYAMAFNPNLELPTLIASYSDRKLCVFNYLTGELQTTKHRMGVTSVACSPDGRLLVVVTLQGEIEVLKFGGQTSKDRSCALRTIYRTGPDRGSLVWAMPAVVASPDGQRLVQIGDRCGRVWAPTVLARKRRLDILTILVPSADGRMIVAGASDNPVKIVSATDPSDVCSIYLLGAPTRYSQGLVARPNIFDKRVGQTIWDVCSLGPHNFILCRARHHHLDVYAIDLKATTSDHGPDRCTKKATFVVDRLLDGAAAYLLFSPDGDRVLVRGERCWDRLCTVPRGIVYLPGGVVEEQTPPSYATGLFASLLHPDARGRSPKSAFQHPTNPNWFIIVTNVIARIYSWTDFTELTRPEGIRLARIANSSSIPRRQLDPASATGVAHPATNPNLDAIAPTVHTILRILWVCTVELQSAPTHQIVDDKLVITPPPATTSSNSTPDIPPIPSSSESRIQATAPTASEVAPTPQARRHFFIPSEWQGPLGQIRGTVLVPPQGPDGSGDESTLRDAAVAFADKDRVVVVRGGFRFEESVVASETDMLSGGVAGESVWKVVGGSMRQARW
ncbi:hypothetical protein C8A05DRAFT_42078 [Staphylotrichum tortipilum]|uniref:GPI inositol-deacylase n=1 Tax=Staphylotrichum tortipilum TaxID=2831512 RepID=A0AAN6MR60_9PEZI|nr:hypothetical protein C8A05DRAFT_42078 [Staphylotrichum longicolle]